jgi:hypothetical protein
MKAWRRHTDPQTSGFVSIKQRSESHAIWKNAAILFLFAIDSVNNFVPLPSLCHSPNFDL